MADIEELLEAAFADKDESTDETFRKQGENLMRSLYSSVAGVSWAMNDFDSFAKDTTKIVGLSIISHWLSFGWESFAEELRAELFDFLFTQCPAKTLNDTVSAALARAQTQFCFNCDPDFTMNAISNFDSTQMAFLFFLDELTRGIIYPSPTKLELFTAIAHKLNQPESMASILNKIASVMNEGAVIGYRILSNMLFWVDLSIALNENVIGFLKYGFSTDEFFEESARGVQALIMRAPQQRQNLINLFNVFDVIQQRFEEYPQTATSLSRLCLIIQGNKTTTDEMFSLVGWILSHEDPGTYPIILPYLCYNPIESAKTKTILFELLYKALTMNVFPSDHLGISTLVPLISRTIHYQFLKDTSDLDREMKEISQLATDESQIGALGMLSYFNINSGWTTPLQFSVFQSAIEELQTEPPFDNKAFNQLYVMLRLCSIFPDLDGNTARQVFRAFITIITHSDTTETQKKKMADSLSSILDKIKNFTLSDNELKQCMTMLTKVLLPNTAVLCSRLFERHDQQQKGAILIWYLNELRKLISAAENKRPLVAFASAFVGRINNLTAVNAFMNFHDFIASTITLFPKDSDLLAKFISGIGALNCNGFALFNTVVKQVLQQFENILPEPSLIQAISYTANKMYTAATQLQEKGEISPQVEAVLDPQFLKGLFDILLEQFVSRMEAIRTTNFSFKQNSRETYSFVQYLFSFFGEIGKCLDEAAINRLVELSEELLSKYNEIHYIINGVFAFLIQASTNKILQPEHVTSLLPLTFYPILTSSFDPYQNNWQLVEMSLYRLHRVWFENYYRYASTLFGTLIKIIGGDDELVQDYLSCFDKDFESSKVDALPMIFMRMVICRDTNFWNNSNAGEN